MVAWRLNIINIILQELLKGTLKLYLVFMWVQEMTAPLPNAASYSDAVWLDVVLNEPQFLNWPRSQWKWGGYRLRKSRKERNSQPPKNYATS